MEKGSGESHSEDGKKDDRKAVDVFGFEPILLQADALQPLFSKYIMEGGANSERPVVENLKLVGRKALSTCRVDEPYFSPTDDRMYHLSAQRGIDFVTQVACAQVLYLNRMRSKTCEMWLNDFDCTYLRPVRTLRFDLEVELIARSVTPSFPPRKAPRTFYKWRFDVEKGAWFGVFTASFPFEDRMTGV
jgi:hypothetical protein